MKSSGGCMVCGASIYRPFTAAPDRMFGGKEVFSYQRCLGCGLLMQQPKISASELKKHYPSSKYYSYQEQETGLFDRIRSYLLKHPRALLTRILPKVPAIPSWVKRGRMLDVGCGTGETLVQLQDLGWSVYGLDIDKNAVRLANRRGLANVSYGSWEDVEKYPDKFFDAIRLYHVIEHLDDPVGCLKLIRRKLKDGGELLIGTPNVGSLIAKVFGSHWYNLDAPRHLFLFTPDNLTRLVKAKGFSVSSVRFCSAGGIIGSFQYLLGIPLLSRAWLVMLVYPIEWTLDIIGWGDVFVLYARKAKS